MLLRVGCPCSLFRSGARAGCTYCLPFLLPSSARSDQRHSHGLAVQVFTQTTGINVIGYYQTIMYDTLGITGSRNTLVAGIYNCIGPLANLVFVVFILDRVGRRKPMLFGSVAISLALICAAALNSHHPDDQCAGYSIGGVFFLFAVSVVFSVSFGPCSWYDSPPAFRGVGCTWRRSCRCRFAARAMPLPLGSGTGRSVHSGIKFPLLRWTRCSGGFIVCLSRGVSWPSTVVAGCSCSSVLC